MVSSFLVKSFKIIREWRFQDLLIPQKMRVLHDVLTKIFSAKTKISTLIGLSKVRVLGCNQDGKSYSSFTVRIEKSDYKTNATTQLF